MTYTESQVKPEGTLIYAILENQRQVQEVIKELDGAPSLRVEQWVAP